MKNKNMISILIIFLMLSSIASAVEIRGTVSDGTLLEWNAQNFAGFFYDLDKNLSSESLIIEEINDNVIPENKLIYKTQKIPVQFEYSKFTDKPVIDNSKTYDLVGWQAENWVALNGKTNKLVKLVVNTGNEKRTVYGGGTITLGNGYVLKVNSIDANSAPRQVWISIIKDGNSIDNIVVQQNEIYNLKKKIGGENDALVLSFYVGSIFSGSETEIVQLQYIWLVDESSLTEIKLGEKFGVFKVTDTSDKIVLKNSGSVGLLKNTEITLMGNMMFKTADSDELRFYPKVNIDVVSTSPIPTPTPTSTSEIYPVVTPEVIIKTIDPTEETCKVYIDNAILNVSTLNITEEPQESEITPETSGFEAILVAIVGILIVTLLVLRQRKD